MSQNSDVSQEFIVNFHRAAYSALAERGDVRLVDDYIKTPWKLTEYKNLYDEFSTDEHYNVDTTSVEKSVMEFLSYVNMRKVAPLPLDGSAYLTVSVTRNYGELAVEFGTSEKLGVDSEGSRMVQWNALLQTVMNMHEYAAANIATIQRATSSPVQTTSGTVEVMATHVRKESYQGKDRIKILCGEWSKWGVPVYEEYYDGLGINPDMDYGDEPYNAIVTVQLTSDGRPSKVISCRSGHE